MDFNIIKGKSILTNIADDYSGVLNVGDVSYINNGIYLCQISATNTTIAPTLKLNGLAVSPIKKNDNTSVAIGDLVINGWYLFMFDAINLTFLKLN